jgi:hypothetical protein
MRYPLQDWRTRWLDLAYRLIAKNLVFIVAETQQYLYNNAHAPHVDSYLSFHSFMFSYSWLSVKPRKVYFLKVFVNSLLMSLLVSCHSTSSVCGKR